MINGAHSIIYSQNPEADKAFLRVNFSVAARVIRRAPADGRLYLAAPAPRQPSGSLATVYREALWVVVGSHGQVLVGRCHGTEKAVSL